MTAARPRGRLFGGVLAAAAVVSVLVPMVTGFETEGVAAATVAQTVTDTGLDLSIDPTGPVVGLATGWLDVSDLAPPGIAGGEHRVRVGVMEPAGEAVADVLFLHGHADRLDNHPALFEHLAARGLRVISFDLPSHGETDAGLIDAWSFDDVAALAGRVERATTEDRNRPFVLVGWSFGGLLETTIVQSPERRAAFSRPIAGLALEAPAIVPLAFSGGDGVSKLRTLTHDLRAPVAGPPSPASPFQDPLFAVRLLAQAQLAAITPLPSDVPALVVLGDPALDRYIDVAAVDDWARTTAGGDGAPVRVLSCDGARHGLDLESWPIGEAVGQAVGDFAVEVATGRTTATHESGACE
ncbi:Lysophospholipase, alpha-beta hydrolase superfamily [Plantibacter flavus]|uniref:Alpha-beta hydrolase superfamily lysophospholipase n=1 Tax=Plantibacter flavus TaxID=150123 RepID=A0A3N2C5V6_9MICO|nr:alpha/beta fold hydrolase [Plantibacter flavus]ROR82820.1 alpha-beta hydrolase superfamily lysophospholipase [Plantibacter flavus]SMG40398.1 Lysophospholipase, alpha-beta hydrolase superfamily [Plantibacter flavus]